MRICTTRSNLRILLALLAICWTGLAFGRAPDLKNRLRDDLISPRVMVEYSDELNMSDAQIAKISKISAASRTEILRLEKEIRSAINQLEQTVKAVPVDEASATKQINAIMTLENRIKSLQFRMLIQSKNVLTQQQLDQLQKLIR